VDDRKHIASDDALILPHHANPAGLNFRERQDDRDCLQDRRKLAVQLEEEQAIRNATSYLPPQHGHLMPQRVIFSLKPALRLKRRGEQRQQEA
jgi:hypothetical protein